MMSLGEGLAAAAAAGAAAAGVEAAAAAALAGVLLFPAFFSPAAIKRHLQQAIGAGRDGKAAAK